MFGLLLAIVYLAFISLGLPDSLLGSAWPQISAEFGEPVSTMGIITMIIAGSTIVSSLLCNFLTKKLGTGLVTALSVCLTAVAMFGFSCANAFWQLCVWAVPYGLGAGAVDAALNNYAALHFSSRHMNWLHCFWGVGVSISPYIMGACISGGVGWQGGYRTVGIIQVVLTAILFCALPLWKKQNGNDRKNDASEVTANGTASETADDASTENEIQPSSTKDALKTRGVWLVFVMFFCYCSLEQTALQWASTYLVQHRGVETHTAATFATLFCTGMTVGRFLSGVFSEKLGDKRLIRIGSSVIFAGIVCLCLPFGIAALSAFVLIGLGCAPIYPAIMHSTPVNFGKQNSQAIVGMQMAFAYIGTTFMPPLFGTFVEKSSWAMPLFLGALFVAMVTLFEVLNKVVASNKQPV